MIDDAVRVVMAAYPQVYFAFHTEHVRDETAGRDVSTKQVSILDHLDAIEPTALHELAGHLGVTPGTMSLAVDRLVNLGYVTRDRDTGDRRRLQLRLTEAGARMRDSMTVLNRDRVRAGLALLSTDELAAALRGIQLLAEAGRRYREQEATG